MRWSALLPLIAALAACDGSPEGREAKYCQNETVAFAMSQEFVRQHLKAPTSAAFPNVTDPQTEAAALGECKFMVASWVDAENAFGGTVRSRYVVDLQYLPNGDTWKALKVVVR